MSKRLLLMAALAFAALVWAPLARADLIVAYRVNGGSYTGLCDDPTGQVCANSAISNGVTILLQSAQSNTPGTPSLSELLQSVLSITNNNLAGTTATVDILIGATNFTMPTTPPSLTLFSHVGGTVPVADPSNLLAFTSCVDQGNGQNVCPATYNAPTLNPNITGGSFSQDSSLAINSLAAPFSMDSLLTITLSGGSQINYTASSTLVPTPEPASLTLFGAALVGLGLFRRRRKQV